MAVNSIPGSQRETEDTRVTGYEKTTGRGFYMWLENGFPATTRLHWIEIHINTETGKWAAKRFPTSVMAEYWHR